MIQSASPPSPNIPKQHRRSQSRSSSKSSLQHPVDHEQRQAGRDSSRVFAAGAKMSNDAVENPTPGKKSGNAAKRVSSEQSSLNEEKSIHSGDLSAVRATPSQRRESKRSDEDSADGEDALPYQAKRTKSLESSSPKILPLEYEKCAVSDLVQVICEMLLDLIRINDPLPLQEGGLTRFHSRIPPAISVLDYLHRLATHATLSPPILLSMVYYIDKLCALYPAFTISSLTVHRFLISSATVASKGLSDAFWTNGTYARVGGVSIRELALLELELLWRIDWRIVPQPEVLTEYYRSLVTRSEGFKLEHPAPPQAAGAASKTTQA